MSTAPSLHKLQTDFMAWILGDRNSSIADSVLGNGLAPDARLGIYRNIVFNNLTATLATAYPAVKALVGDEFFDGAAARYVRDEPSLSGNLQDYGARFPDLLSQMPEARSLPYLADIARLEWARQESLIAADATAFDPSQLASVPDERQASLRLQLHPSLQLIESSHSVLDIWLYCQEPGDARLNLDGTGQRVMLWRSENAISMRAVDAGLFMFLIELRAGATLLAANDAATAIDSHFRLDEVLAVLFADQLVTGYEF